MAKRCRKKVRPTKGSAASVVAPVSPSTICDGDAGLLSQRPMAQHAPMSQAESGLAESKRGARVTAWQNNDNEDDDDDNDDNEEVKPTTVEFKGIDDDEDDEDDELELPPEVVSNDDPEILAFLRTAVQEKVAPLPLADWLKDRDDPRAPLVQELVAPRPIVPVKAVMWNGLFSMVSAPTWRGTLQPSRVVITTYPGTLLSGFLSSRGQDEAEVRLSRDRTHEGILAAFERCRMKLVLALFDTTEADLRTTNADPLAARVARLVRSLRRLRATTSSKCATR